MQNHGDFSGQLAENGPIAKISTLNSKDRDRRKSQGERLIVTLLRKIKSWFLSHDMSTFWVDEGNVQINAGN